MSAARSVAALYDIHGNLPALEAVLAELPREPPDAVISGGDVAAGPMPREVLARLRELPWPVYWLRGNADRAVVMGFDRTIPPEPREHPLFQGDAWAATFLSRALGYPAAELMFEAVDPDEVAERYEAVNGQPPADASLIAPEDNPLRGRRGVTVAGCADHR